MDYKAKPLHFLLPIFFFMVGAKCAIEENTFLKTTGIAFFIGSFGSYVVILVAGVLPHYVAYWQEINRFAELMLKNQNPELWRALGFHAPDQKAELITKATDNGPAYPSYEITKLPVSRDAMAIIAKGIIVDGLPFSEYEWVTKRQVVSSKKFRALQDLFAEKHYVRPNHARNPKMGYAPTRRGAVVLYEYAGLPLPSPIALKVVKT